MSQLTTPMAIAAMIAPLKPWTSMPGRNLSLKRRITAAMTTVMIQPSKPPPMVMLSRPRSQNTMAVTTAITMAAMIAADVTLDGQAQVQLADDPDDQGRDQECDYAVEDNTH